MEEKESFRSAGASAGAVSASRKAPWRILPVIAVSCVLTVWLFGGMLKKSETQAYTSYTKTNVMDTYETYLSDQIRGILGDAAPQERTYQLSDDDMVAPTPNPDNYGQSDSPAQLQWLLDDAADLLDGQSFLFSTATQIKEGSTVHYYLDDTIFAVTWKQVFDDCVYTFSEVKIAHPSQFRRFLSNGQYGSGVLHTTSEMSESINAVVASSGDYYDYRSFGIVVNDGQVYRGRGHLLDTCYIDENGDLLFTYAGDITDAETAQKFVDEHNVRFSLSFGPVMILNGEYCVPSVYNSGEINDPYARAALCQLGSLHYMVVTANSEDPHYCVPTVGEVALNLQSMGVTTAYALDGGQTAAIVMNDELINTVSYGSQREISDIIYFATALPYGEDSEVSQ